MITRLRQRFTRTPDVLQGMALMLFAMLNFSIMSTLIRGLGSAVPSAQMVLLRNFFALVMMLVIVLPRGRAHLRTHRLRDHAVRSGIGFVAMQLWFLALTLMPVTQAVALSFTTPLFITVFALLFLGEKAGPRRYCALVVGYIGAFIILRPDRHGFPPQALVVLAASAMMAASSIVVKALTRTEAPTRIVFYMALFMTLFSIPFGIAAWQPITLWHVAALAVIGVTSTAAQIAMAQAYLRAPMVVLMPLDFTRLIFTAIFAWFAFGETLNAHTLLGAGMIVLSAAYIAHREAVRSAAAPRPPMGA